MEEKEMTLTELFNTIVTNSLNTVENSLLEDYKTQDDSVPLRGLCLTSRIHYGDDSFLNLYESLKNELVPVVANLYRMPLSHNFVVQYALGVAKGFIIATVLGNWVQANIKQPTSAQYVEEVHKICSEVRDLFSSKNDTYKSDTDPMMNFSKGGVLLFDDYTYEGKFAALKGYCAKHVVTAINNNVNFTKLTESTKDITTYFLIAVAMKLMYSKEEAAKKAAETTAAQPEPVTVKAESTETPAEPVEVKFTSEEVKEDTNENS